MLLWAFNIGEWLRVVEEGGQGMIGVQRQILWHVHPCLIFPRYLKTNTSCGGART